MARIKNDNYPTPELFARSGVIAALNVLGKCSDLDVFEPGCGDTYPHISMIDGSIYKTSVGLDIRDLKTHSELHVSDIDRFIIPNVDYVNTDRDELRSLIGGNKDLIITNPPYVIASDFIDVSLDLLNDGGVASFFLKLDFLGTKVRLEKFKKEWPFFELRVFGKRPSFVTTKASSTDMHNYGYYAFKKGYNGSPSISWFDF